MIRCGSLLNCRHDDRFETALEPRLYVAPSADIVPLIHGGTAKVASMSNCTPTRGPSPSRRIRGCYGVPSKVAVNTRKGSGQPNSSGPAPSRLG
jgi:hypothetical protein